MLCISLKKVDVIEYHNIANEPVQNYYDNVLDNINYSNTFYFSFFQHIIEKLREPRDVVKFQVL